MGTTTEGLEQGPGRAARMAGEAIGACLRVNVHSTLEKVNEKVQDVPVTNVTCFKFLKMCFNYQHREVLLAGELSGRTSGPENLEGNASTG